MYNLLSLQPATARPRGVVCAAANQTTIPRGAQASRPAEEDIYIGNGKFVKDDPRKYPSRDFTGTGGWAGGEAGLQKFVDQLKREGYGAKVPRVQTPSGTQIIRADKLDGKDLVYVGKGEFVRDDSRKYANKEDAGFLAGATGGFAGGEQGVQMFIEKGNLSFAEAEVIKQRQLTKDLITLGSLVGLSGAAAFWLRQQGILSFELPQVSPADVAASATATSSSAISSAAAVGSSVTPVVQEHPEVVAYLLAAAGVLAGTVAVRKGIEQISNRMVDGFKRKTVQALYLVAVAAAAYVLVMDQ